MTDQPPMNDEELEDWGIAFIEEMTDETDVNDPSLTEDQREWLAAFFSEVDEYRD